MIHRPDGYIFKCSLFSRLTKKNCFPLMFFLHICLFYAIDTLYIFIYLLLLYVITAVNVAGTTENQS